MTPTTAPHPGALSTLAVRGPETGEREPRPGPFDHLTPEQVDEIARELDAIRDEVLASRGADDAAYIHRVITTQRWLEAVSRATLLFSRFPPAWVLGTLGLSISKILENMEIGHNVLHGQWDWMRDQRVHSSTWEWDSISPAAQWKQRHNVEHHTFTNVVGMDNDLGYHQLRVDPSQPWSPKHLAQPLINLLMALTFEYGIALYDLEYQEYLAGEKSREDFLRDLKATLAKLGRQVARDYVAHPLLSIGSFVPTLAANMVANTVRNVWEHTVIMCGHLPAGVETFEIDSIEGETKGQWYLRQMVGSANISGGRVMGLMSGHLSHQIEHHLFPDLPSNRYEEVSIKVRELMQRYGLAHVSGPLHRQAGSAWAQVFRYSLPNRRPGMTRAAQALDWLGRAVRPKGRVQALPA